MTEYIERKAALVICEKTYQERIRMSDWCGDTVAWNIGHEIKTIPSADVAPVRHGRWEEHTGSCWQGCADDGSALALPTRKCSNCGKPIAIVMWDNYCPNCGAKML